MTLVCLRRGLVLVLSDNFKIQGYVMLRSDHNPEKWGHSEVQMSGGVALYIKEGIVLDEHTLSESVDPGTESLCVILRVMGLRLGFSVVYRPPCVRYTSLTALFHSISVGLAIQVNTYSVGR
uniref:Uncharacterized protein n=1 Tax=Graphocephala atropunctata TaxID=36148 RepID=A0A1B6M026_9HEMI